MRLLLWSSINNKGGKFAKKEEVIEYINETEKEIKRTHGFSWKNPTTYKVTMKKEKAINLIKKSSLIDITEEEDFVHLNTFSSNDMW